MPLNINAKESFYQFDEAGMCWVPSDKSWEKRSWWKKLWDWVLKREWHPTTWENKSWRDAIGRTVLAWMAYNQPEELKTALAKCYDGKNLLRHPEYKERSSRDHWSYFIMFKKLSTGDATVFLDFIDSIPMNKPSKRGMKNWMWAIAGDKRAEWWYYFWNIPFAYLGNWWLKRCRKWGNICPIEMENEWWIGKQIVNGKYIQDHRTKWQNFWGKVILWTIPAFALHNKAWQIYFMPESKKRKKIQRILLKRAAKRNVLVRLILEDPTVTKREVDEFPAMTSFPSGCYLDESCRRDIKKDPSKWNTYEKDLVKEMWKRGFPCYNCTAKEPGHPDYCEFAWDEYNYGKTIWDCLGAK